MTDTFQGMKYAVYLDSRDTNTISIVNKWFKYGFFSKELFVVIFRYYPNTAIDFCEELGRQKFQYIGYNKFSSININKLDVVFYPFNTNTNPLLIKNQTLKHVFIGHGESDKKASVNPMIRMYDHIFVSGSTSINRYLEHKLINNEDTKNGRVVKIGMPYVGDLYPSKKEMTINQEHIQGNAVIYCPTWEGATKEQQYSSLEDDFGLDLVSALLASGQTVIFQPHPSTGIKDKTYKGYIQKIVAAFHENPNFIFAANNAGQRDIANKFKSLTKTPPEEVSWNTLKMCFTDTSSMISASIFHHIPVVHINKGGTERSFLNDFMYNNISFKSNRSLLITTLKIIDYKKAKELALAQNKSIVEYDIGCESQQSNKDLFDFICLNLSTP